VIFEISDGIFDVIYTYLVVVVDGGDDTESVQTVCDWFLVGGTPN
jgi:hypothetical protein